MRYAQHTVRVAVAAIMITLALPASVAQSAPAPMEVPTSHQMSQPQSERQVRPSRGGAGRYADSNVYDVWKGASHAERSFWLCVRNHESRHSGHYRAANPRSSARGAGQWLRGTWAGVVVWVRYHGRYIDRRLTKYPTADKAPAWIQDLVFRHVWKHGGQSMWRGTHCGYGT